MSSENLFLGFNKILNWRIVSQSVFIGLKLKCISMIIDVSKIYKNWGTSQITIAILFDIIIIWKFMSLFKNSL